MSNLHTNYRLENINLKVYTENEARDSYNASRISC